MNQPIMDKYKQISDRYNQLKRKFQLETQPYLLDQQVIKKMHKEIVTRQKELIHISNTDQRIISKYFMTYQPLSCNIAIFKDLHLFGGPKIAFNNGKVYIGTIVDGKRHGKGVIACSKGRIYEGQMLNNQRNGLGVEIYQDSNFYVGNFLDNKRSGQGKIIWVASSEEGQVTYQYYQGEWKDGEPYGYGFHYTDKVAYAGLLKNGIKNGKGIEITDGKGLYEGFFVNGHREGKGFFFQEKGQCYEGDYKSGNKHGYGKQISLQVFEQYEGFFQNNNREGIGFLQMPNRVTYRGFFSEGKPNGTGQYSNSLKRSIQKSSAKQDKYLMTQLSVTKKVDNSHPTLRQRVDLKSAQLKKGSNIIARVESRVADKKQKLFSSKATEKIDRVVLPKRTLYSAKPSILHQPCNPEQEGEKKCKYKSCSCNSWERKSQSKIGVDQNRLKRLFSSRKLLLKQFV